MNTQDQQKFAGMTVNERLFVSGLIAEFDAAMQRRDIPKIRALLTQVYVDGPSIEKLIKNLQQDTESY